MYVALQGDFNHQETKIYALYSIANNAVAATANIQHPETQSGTDETLSANDSPDAPKKNRSLLHVPSRSSSHKIQPSPTSTGLSGATASDPNDSIGRHSKDSTNSIIGGTRRNGSVASSKRDGTSTGGAPGNAGRAITASPQSPPMQKPKKSGGFLGFLNCCAAPDNPNGLDSDEIPLPAKKVNRVPSQTTATTSSKPNLSTSGAAESAGGRSTVPDIEKDALRQTVPSQASNSGEKEVKGSLSSSGGSLKQGQSKGAIGRQLSAKEIRNQQPLPPVPQDADKPVRTQDNVSYPAVTVEAPTTVPQKEEKTTSTPANSSQQNPDSTDNSMTEAQPAPSDEEKSKSLPTDQNDSQVNKSSSGLPPPPPILPVSTTGPAKESVTTDPAEEKQQWLLPPIEPRFHGKKCLVLDLDETLVHSSFKVS